MGSSRWLIQLLYRDTVELRAVRSAMHSVHTCLKNFSSNNTYPLPNVDAICDVINQNESELANIDF